MSRQQGTALITGASMGIGAELARCFAQHGHSVILLARSEQRLHDLASELQQKYDVSADVVVSDLSLPDSPDAVYSQIRKQNRMIDFLVNNAGIGSYGLFQETDWEREQQMLQINIVALTHLTKLFLPDMIQRKQGRILNVASTAAFQPGPLMACYYASKAYVLHFSEAIANELHGSGVTVTALCPGPTLTPFVQSAKMEKSRLFRRPDVMDAATVARIGYRGMMKGKRIVIPGIGNKLLVFSVRFGPRRLVTAISGRFAQ